MSFGYDIYEYARRGDMEGLREAVVKNKPDTYMAYDGSTALIMAARSGHGDVVRELLAHRASVDHRTDDGSTCLHHAVSGGAIVAVNSMIKAGVRPDEANEDGVTPLILAAHYGYRSICQLLIDKKADVGVCAEGWGTALDSAKEQDVIDVLEKNGAKRSGDGAGQNVAKGAERFYYGCFEEGTAADAPAAAEPAAAPEDLPPDGDRATAEGTARFLAARLHADARPRVLGSTGLAVAPVGFGCHRVEDEAPHRAAVALAIAMGANFLDAAPNYTDGVAETVVGEVLRELIGSQKIRRDELIIATKVGNVLGQQLQHAEGVPGMTKVDNSLLHCISPEWIEQEITRSLQRLQVSCLDVVLLHNPESEAKSPGVDMAEVYRRIGAAFLHLEAEVARGRVAYYGVSAAFMPLRPTDPEHLHLPEVLAQLPPGESRFRVLQFPVNFAEAPVLSVSHGPRSPEGALLGGATEEMPPSLLEMAQKHGLATLANRPLNGIWKEAHGILRFSSLDCDARTFSDLQLESCDQLEEKLTKQCKLDGRPFNAGDGASGQLAAKTVKVLASASGVDCVLLGMRKPEYVAGTLPLAFQTPRLDASLADAAIKHLHDTLGMWFATSISESDHGTSKTWRLPVQEKWSGEHALPGA